MRKLVLPAVLTMLFAVRGGAQTGAIRGTITNAQSGAPIASATVELQNQETGMIFRAASSAEGTFSFDRLPSARYHLQIVARHFRSYAHANLEVTTSSTIREDVKLQPGEIRE